MKNLQLKEQFEQIDKMPIFEIETTDGYEIYNINATDYGLYTQGINGDGIGVEWDDVFSLDEHLQELYEKCYEDCNGIA